MSGPDMPLPPPAGGPVGVGGAGLVVEAPDADTMREVGRRLAGVLRAGDLVVLAGPLGAGKTVLVQGIAAGLGVAGAVTSPTFVIARVHVDGRVPLVHVDAYRLGGFVEVEDIDLDADIEESVTVVEWGSGLVEGLASTHLRVEIERPEDAMPLPLAGTTDAREVPDAGGRRVIRMVGSGGDWPQRMLSLLPSLPDAVTSPTSPRRWRDRAVP
ncbi:hypothetical protein FDG2_5751 [Candidatus Protofrankia californiensis]|uniref:tRNA threonylcarbamoyladenosine biosynthesis protein TsaE n=1 Tax=Candidatus Protofrankia californiensis TaxID=1839754 RepID=A0A1C3PFQ0_9ACTN|nr:hypothetical protein FDG2_5751 [Candidatus Protofrankia californiensis]